MTSEVKSQLKARGPQFGTAPTLMQSSRARNVFDDTYINTGLKMKVCHVGERSGYKVPHVGIPPLT